MNRKAKERRITQIGTRAVLSALLDDKVSYIAAIQELSEITGTSIIQICYEITKQAIEIGFGGYEKNN